MFNIPMNCFAGLFLALTSFWIQADELPRATPEQVGISSERLTRLDKVMQNYVDKSILAGVVTLIARHGRIAHLSAIGKMDLDTGAAMKTDSLFRLHSMTKPITSVALLMLYEEGYFQLADTVESYIPAFKDLKVFNGVDNKGKMVLVDQKRKMSIHDIFRHTAGLGYGWGDTPVDDAYRKAGIESSPSIKLQDLVAILGTLPLLYQPGKRWVYSYAHDVQAYLVEHFSGMPFDKFLQTRLFGPLDMTDTSFGLPRGKLDRLTTLYGPVDNSGVTAINTYSEPGLVVIEKPATSEYLKRGDYPAGGTGLISSAEDYFRFAQMLLNGGKFNGKQILSPKTVELMTRNHIPAELWQSQPFGGGGYGLGVSVRPEQATTEIIGSAGQFGWAGAATTYVIIDPVEDMISILLTQYQPLIIPLFQQFQTLVYQAIIN